jgi:hypothetical protein
VQYTTTTNTNLEKAPRLRKHAGGLDDNQSFAVPHEVEQPAQVIQVVGV